jgi:hypothetical protein
MHGLDKKTFGLIKQLLHRRSEEPKKFTEIDEKYLKLLLNRDIDFD